MATATIRQAKFAKEKESSQHPICTRVYKECLLLVAGNASNAFAHLLLLGLPHENLESLYTAS